MAQKDCIKTEVARLELYDCCLIAETRIVSEKLQYIITTGKIHYDGNKKSYEYFDGIRYTNKDDANMMWNHLRKNYTTGNIF